jgi:Tol biopolymer transport system component
MRKYLTLIVAVVLSLTVIGAAPVQAEEEMDTVLAQAAAKGFLTTLTRPDLSDTIDFYLLDSLQADSVLAELQDVTGYEITEVDWVSQVTYQVKAVLQPGNREIAVYTGKYNGRWLVEGLDLPAASTTAAETVAATLTPVTDDGAVPVSGNGTGKLVFQTQSGGDIYVINANGSGLQWVTTGMDRQLSPDGTKIAFTRWEPRYELFSINIDGTGEQTWTHGWRQMKSPTWTADGSKLVFSWQDGGRLEDEEVRINLEDAAREGEKISIPSGCVGLEQKGKYLECILPADTYWHLKQIDLGTTEFTDLGTENYSYGPSGHPTDPDQIIFKGQSGLAMYNAQTNSGQPITNDYRDHTPVISPDGSQIVVSYWQDGHWEIHTMNIDGSNRQRLTSTPLSVLAENRTLTTAFVAGEERFVASENPAWNNAAPTWSPDGSQIAFLTDRTGQWEIWIMNADGSNQRPMFPNGALDGLTLNYTGVDERMFSWQ